MIIMCNSSSWTFSVASNHFFLFQSHKSVSWSSSTVYSFQWSGQYMYIDLLLQFSMHTLPTILDAIFSSAIIICFLILLHSPRGGGFKPLTSPSGTATDMGCGLNPEQLQTEPCSNHQATLTGPGLASVALCFKHGSVRSCSRFKAQPMRALAGGLVRWCLNLIGCQTIENQ